MGDAVRERSRCFRGARALRDRGGSPGGCRLGSRRRALGWLRVVAVSGLLLYEHLLVRPGDLRLRRAFFTVNGVISVVFLVFVALDTLT